MNISSKDEFHIDLRKQRHNLYRECFHGLETELSNGLRGQLRSRLYSRLYGPLYGSFDTIVHMQITDRL